MSTSKYTIKKGDTLSQIAQQWGTSAKALANLNNIKNANKIMAGGSLLIPAQEVQQQNMLKQAQAFLREQAEAAAEQAKETAEYSKEQFKGAAQKITDAVRAKAKTVGESLQKVSFNYAAQPRTTVRTEAPPEADQSVSKAPVSLLEKPRERYVNPRGRGGEKGFDESLAATKRQWKRNTPVEQTGQFSILNQLGFNIDPFKLLLDQAKLSISERLLGKGSRITKSLAEDITEKDLSRDVVQAMRANTIKMFESGAETMDDASLLGATRRSDVMSEEGLMKYLTDPSLSQALITGQTDVEGGGITLDKDNNMIINDIYDFGDYDESLATTPFMKVHNLFEDRGKTGKEGFTSGLFEVSRENTRNMRINLGKAPASVIKAIKGSQYLAQIAPHLAEAEA